VISGPQGDYHARSATPANDGPVLPSGRKLGDLNSPGTIIHDTWLVLEQAPSNRMRTLGMWSFNAMIYETAWHEEDQVDYSNPNCYGPWNFPDQSWDGVNTWALRLANHIRDAGVYAVAARWADSIRAGLESGLTRIEARDLDLDGENELVIRNAAVFAVFERAGGRCVLAATWDAGRQDAEIIVGAPLTNPSSPGEEELTGPAANRCSAFKDMNGGAYADALYAATAVPRGWRFTSPDGRIQKTFTVADGAHEIEVAYVETVDGPLYVRLGLSPNPLDLAFHGRAHLSSELRASPPEYWLVNSAGGGARVRLGGTTFNPAPSDAGFERRNLALTEQVELSGDGAFSFGLGLLPTHHAVTAAEPARPDADLEIAGPYPSPASRTVSLSFVLPKAGAVRYDLLDAAGRRVGGGDLGLRSGRVEISWDAGGALPPGLYFVRVRAGERSVTRRWAVVH
jgi:hypothetical protein